MKTINEKIELMTLEKIENRLNFNQFSEIEYTEFKNQFLSDSEENKINNLIKIIEETDENLLLEGNFKNFFNEDGVIILLKKCL